MSNSSKGFTIKPILAAAALAIVMSVSVAGTANADPRHDGRRGHDWHDHEYHNHAWFVAHPYYEPGYVVAPPPVVYAPPPPSPGINLILPLNFR